MDNINLSFNSKNYHNLGEILSAYIYTIRSHSHREPLKAVIVFSDTQKIYSGFDALVALKQIQSRKNDGVEYECVTDLSGEIPETVIIKASCSEYFYWHGHERRKFDECYNEEKGYFDVYPYNCPFGTDFSKGTYLTTIVDHKTGEILKDEKERNLSVYGYIAWSNLISHAEKLYKDKVAFDFLVDGIPQRKLGHVGPRTNLIQNEKTGKWRAV